MNPWFVGALGKKKKKTFLLWCKDRFSIYFTVFLDFWVATLEIQVQIHLITVSDTLNSTHSGNSNSPWAVKIPSDLL